MAQSSPIPLYLQIAETFRRQILSGELQPGDRLPAVRVVAREWGCTPGTVNRAYRTLARDGLVISHPGKGTVIAGGVPGTPMPAWGWASLVNRAESYLLETVQSGFALRDGEIAVSLAAANLREALERGAPALEVREADRMGDLRFVGSHDLLVELLTRFLEEGEPAYSFSATYAGSLGGLIALARGEADLCGIHLWDSLSDTYNTPFVLRILPGRRILLLTLAHRHLGLILAPGNPDRVQSLADLARPGVHFVNRQPGSGTRVWLDARLAAAGIPHDQIPGYDRVETTHSGVADVVARGAASAGLGIFAAAASLGLHFIPLTRERYEFAVPEELAGTPKVQRLIEVVRSGRTREAIRLLGGYDDGETGSVRWVS